MPLLAILKVTSYNKIVLQATIQQILELNRQFYQNLAGQFSSTRLRLQPGMQKVLHLIPDDVRVLDLGCGNGEFWHGLYSRGFQGEYIGIDFSINLLRLAHSRQITKPLKCTPPTDRVGKFPEIQPKPGIPLFIQKDLSQDNWESFLADKEFDFILAFSVLHHIPGTELRHKVLKKIHNLLSPNGCFIHSEWQFLESERLRARIQPWEIIGLSSDLVDMNDYLLDWRHGGYGLRYVHYFSEEELSDLAKDSQFMIIESFRSDGQGGKLGLYQIWGNSIII